MPTLNLSSFFWSVVRTHPLLNKDIFCNMVAQRDKTVCGVQRVITFTGTRGLLLVVLLCNIILVKRTVESVLSLRKKSPLSVCMRTLVICQLHVMHRFFECYFSEYGLQLKFDGIFWLINFNFSFV